MGQAMSVNRPSGYVDPSKAAVAAQAATHALTAFQQVLTDEQCIILTIDLSPLNSLPPVYPKAPPLYPTKCLLSSFTCSVPPQGGYTGLQAGASALTGPMAAVGAIQSAAVAQVRRPSVGGDLSQDRVQTVYTVYRERQT